MGLVAYKVDHPHQHQNIILNLSLILFPEQRLLVKLIDHLYYMSDYLEKNEQTLQPYQFETLLSKEAVTDSAKDIVDIIVFSKLRVGSPNFKHFNAFDV